MAEIVPVVSEALEKTVRDLLPSQRGFGEDLQASNVITPIIDLTRSAEGTQTPEILQTAINFGGSTAFSLTAPATDTITTTGFWRITGVFSMDPDSGGIGSVQISQTDGLTSKNVWRAQTDAEADPSLVIGQIDLVFFNATGISLTINAAQRSRFSGSYRQIADVNGNLINPTGFTPQ